MMSLKTGIARVVVVVIALTAMALVYLDAQGSVAGTTTALADQEPAGVQRSSSASQAEADITRTNLAGKLEAALGDAFGGVWFEPATAQLHVGVTSAASRRNAEAVAAQAGLTGIVTETSVDSTWVDLEAAQERWNRRLADMFQHGEVATSLAPDHNSVEVDLSSSVSSSVRASLEGEAAAESVDVSIVETPSPHFGGRPLARCEKFVKGLAFCDPTIVAGVTLDSEVVGKTRQTCTTGPTAILKNRAKAPNATRTYVLTAGHCIEKGGGVGKKWYAYNKEGVGKGEKEVGLARSYIYNGTDVGAIEVKIGYWAKAKDFTPVVPTVASWSAGAESEPFPVIAQRTPVKNTKSCMSGQMVGTVCGEIITTDQSLNFSGVVISNLIEVKGVAVENGDSGAPWFAEKEFKEATPTGYVEGTLVGENVGNTNPVFQSLDTSFAELKKVKSLDLELLTTANEKRKHPLLKAGKYPVTIHGSTSIAQKFNTEAGSIECKSSTYHAVISEAGTATLAVTPEYKECTASFLEKVSATVSMEGCAFVFYPSEKVSADNYPAPTDVSCPEGKSIKFVAGTCKAEIKSQAELESVDLVDDTSASPKKDITLRPTLAGIAYTVTQDGVLCPFNGTGEKTGGEYTSSENITLTGQSTTEPSVKIDVEVADE